MTAKDAKQLRRGMEAFERELRSMPRATWWEGGDAR